MKYLLSCIALVSTSALAEAPSLDDIVPLPAVSQQTEADTPRLSSDIGLWNLVLLRELERDLLQRTEAYHQQQDQLSAREREIILRSLCYDQHKLNELTQELIEENSH